MRIAMCSAFVMLVAGPLLGRWRARVWLRKNEPAKACGFSSIAALNCEDLIEKDSLASARLTEELTN
jgi:hypothetical protein